MVATELVGRLLAPGPVHDDYLACTPLGRHGEVGDIASVARFLLSDESAWMTGVVLNVDGGHHLRRGPDISPLFAGVFGPEALRGIVDE